MARPSARILRSEPVPHRPGSTGPLPTQGAVAEMVHFRLAPLALFAVLVITLELISSAMVMSGFLRWFGALALAGFTLLSTLIALRF